MYAIDKNGYYGNYGGAYIPELLWNNIEDLNRCFEAVRSDASFWEKYIMLCKEYVGRPTPLYLAERLSDRYQTSVYLKREDLNHTGSHKINNALGQIMMAQRMGKSHIIAETGAGQHGVATATVCALMGLECTVFMGALDVERQAANVARMKLLGAQVVSVTSGNQTLKDACNEAIRYWINHAQNTYYIIGSVVGPAPYPEIVRYFQQIISQEVRSQMLSLTGQEKPSLIMACVGGGSNAAGIFSDFMEDRDVALVGVEAAGMGIDSDEHAASIAKGSLGIIHGSKTLLLQTNDGQIIEPYSISAGLDYPGIGPIHAYLHESKRASYLAVTDAEAVQAGLLCMRLEGIIPALETAHALAGLNKIEASQYEHIVLCFSGRGDKDVPMYLAHLK